MRGFKDGYGFVGLVVFFLCGFMTLQLGLLGNAAAYQVKIAAPTNDSVVSGSVPISLLMRAGTSFSNVYVDGVYLASTPNAISWLSTNAANGMHTISAKAYDSANQVIGTSSRLVRVKNRPSPTPTPSPTGQLRISSPSNGATVSGTVSVSVQYAAPVNWLNFYVDGNWVASSPPYAFSWTSSSVANGTHTIAVNGYNTSNALVASTSISVTVKNGTSPSPTPTVAPTPPPTATPAPTPTPAGGVSISSPKSGATVSGTVSIVAQNIAPVSLDQFLHRRELCRVFSALHVGLEFDQRGERSARYRGQWIQQQ